MPQNKPTEFMDSAIFTLHNYASSQREESLLLRLLQTALQEEIKYVMRSFNRGARGQNALRQILAPVVKEIIEDESLNVRTDPVDIYKCWVNQMGSQNGEAGYGMRFIAKVLKDSRHDKFPDAGEDELLKLSLVEEQSKVTRNGCGFKTLVYLVLISCQLVVPAVMGVACSEISCGPDMARVETENNGKPLLVREESSLNIPAIGAAHVLKRYVAQAPDELSLEVGDLVCVIEMPPQELSPRWRGKHGFQVGFFPGECVELINGKIPESLINSVPKPVPKKRGKLLTFLRSVVKARPKQRKEREVEKERVFGRDLGEHLLHSGRDVPQVLQSCAEFIEQHGVVQGIYRLSGVASNVQRLRQEFESEQVPELTVRDVHSASSLCKMYFRELPTPLLTDQLYDKFSDAVGATTEEERLVRMRDVIQQLPAPHYRTLVFLMRHLACLAAKNSVTNMHAKNLAIVWAPNLLRSQQSESACASGRAACMELQTQSAVVEFIINHTDVLFCSTSGSDIADGAGHSSLSGPQSVRASSAATELLSLEEAQARRRGHSSSPVVVTESRDIGVEEGPTAVRGKFHTVIDFPPER
ncbi:rho GTPase-activating protein 32-like isoform X1 [Tympanuchus pallidicinctus]|uniref:rho GTPase-activating protein 32-like isoform X1 n=2 Tax=Tympanuchus pallidicinctus TaxID=109042 RepID=UPI0022870163|nr:rho GTPase-activating protein 32-like isoform X1 [Tympanuchus pallidicinctus]